MFSSTEHPMTTLHTSAPWTVDHLGQIIGPRDGCSHEIIAHMPVWFPVAPPGKHATQDHVAANAHLIASTPDLLAALRDIVDSHGTDVPGGWDHRVVSVARAAIAKAGGEK